MKSSFRNWSPEDVNAFSARIDRAKEELGCSVTDLLEGLEVLDFIQNLIPDCTFSEHQFFLDATDDLVALLKNRLDRFRENVMLMEGQ